MKKIRLFILTLLITLTMSACTQQNTPTITDNKTPETNEGTVIDNNPAPSDDTSDNDEPVENQTPENNEGDNVSDNEPVITPKEDKVLILYFTLPETDGVDTVAGASRVAADGRVYGNLEYAATIIHQTIGGDLQAIETVQDYPGTHEELLDFAENEYDEDIHPALSSQIDLEGYSTILFGYPIWYADLPMPLYTFFDTYDLSGKTIIPFTVHGGSGFASTISTIRELEPNAIISENQYSVSRNAVADAAAEIAEWANTLNLN